MSRTPRFFFASFALIAMMLFGLFGARAVFAQGGAVQGLQAVGAVTNLPATNPIVIATRIINIALGTLAIIMVTLMLYAGFTWMTAGGDPAKVERAKMIIRNAIIGLIIILSSWAITLFILSKFTGAVGTGGGVVTGPGPGGGLGGGGGISGFQIQSITPTGDNVIRNAVVRINFTKPVDPTSAASSITVTRKDTSAPVNVAMVVDGTLVKMTPLTPCPAPNADRFCFDSNTAFTIHVGGGLTSTQDSGQLIIACGGFAPVCDATFTTNDVVATTGPFVQITTPYDGQNVPVDDVVPIATESSDQWGVSLIQTFVDTVRLGQAGPLSTSTTQQFSTSFDWDTHGVSTGTHSLMSVAYDLDENHTSSSWVNVAVRPQYCFDKVQDYDETGVDCGPSCGVCAGGSCRVATDCRGGVCKNGVCQEQPIITGFTPTDGAPGTFVTVVGANFGDHPGSIYFTNNVPAFPPAACVAAKIITWTSTYATVAVPDGAVSGPISLTNSNSQLSTTSTANFTVDDLHRPGICSAVPDHGEIRTPMSLIGALFGNTFGRLFFTDGANNQREVTSFNAWTDGRVDLVVPTYSPASYAVGVSINNVDSNRVPFHIDQPAPQADPQLTSLDPTQGPVGEYVTLTGLNFGTQPGIVWFRNPATQEEGPADVQFPDVCPSNFWQDQHIVVKVPATIGALNTTQVTAGKTYEFYVKRQSDGKTTNALPFTVTSDPPKPGLCAILPIAGPAGTIIQLMGERFGSRADTIRFTGDNQTLVNVNGDSASWTPNSVSTTVPLSAVSGAVKIVVGTAASNGIPFDVQNCNSNPQICTGKTICCKSGACSDSNGVCSEVPLTAQFAWYTSTGIIPINPEVAEDCQIPPNGLMPSPSPWDSSTR